MLKFNHYHRMSAKELLKHEIFDDIRVDRLERGAPYRIHLLCDAKDAFNYSKKQDKYCETIDDYLLLIESEIL